MAKRRSSSPAPAKASPTTRDVRPPGLRIAWWSLHALLFLVPVAMSNFTWMSGFITPFTYDQFDIAKIFVMRTLAVTGFAGWAWHALGSGVRLRRTKIDLGILALLAWVLITTITSISPATAVFGKYRRYEGLISFIVYAVVFFLVVQLVDKPHKVRSMARTFFFSSIVVNGYGVLQYIGADPINWGRLPFEVNRAFSTYGNPDLLGGFLVLSLPIALVLALSENNITWRTIYWGGLLLGVACWIVAFTRGAWIGGAVALLIVLAAGILYRVRLKGEDYVFLGISAVVVAGLVVRSLGSENSVMNVGARLRSILDFGEGSARTRFQIWQAAIDAIKDRPIFGFGADTFRLVFPKYKPVEYVAHAGYLSVADNVHNYPLQVTSALGIPGFLLLYGTFATAGWNSFRSAFTRDDGSGDRLVLAGIWAACAGYLVNLMFGLSVTGTSVVLWAFIGLALSPVARSVQLPRPSWGMPALAVVLVLCAALLVGNIIYVRADNHYLYARVLSQGEERVGWIEKAIALNPYNDLYRAELGLAYTEQLRGALEALRQGTADKESTQARARDYFLKAEASFKDTIRFVPWEYDNYVFLASLYVIAGQSFDEAYIDDAIEWGKKGVEVEPFGPAIRYQLGQAYLLDGDLDAARAEGQLAVDMDPNYLEPKLLVAEVARLQGDVEVTREMYEAVLKKKPDYPGVADWLKSIESTTTTP